MFNVTQIHSLRQARIELVHPVTEQPVGAFVTLLASEHADRRQALLEYQRLLRKIGDGDGEEQVRRRHEAHVQYIVSCMAGWEGIAEDDKEIAYSAATATELLTRPEMGWLLAQISMHLISGKNFIAAQPKA